MKKFITTGLCVLALGLSFAHVANAAEMPEIDQNAVVAGFFRKKDKGAAPEAPKEDIPANVPPEEQAPAEDAAPTEKPEQSNEGSFVDLADLNRPRPGRQDAPITPIAPIAPNNDDNQVPAETTPNNVPNTTPNTTPNQNRNNQQALAPQFGGARPVAPQSRDYLPGINEQIEKILAADPATYSNPV
jgi:hypothetical protein